MIALASAELRKSRLWSADKAPIVSPIETKLFDAVRRLVPKSHFLDLTCIDDLAGSVHREAPVLYWCAQKWLLDWPVDFIFSVFHFDHRAANIVCECDGHQFHEATKEQAARDRSRDRRLQAAGYIVFRFTGSEIAADADACAASIIEMAWQARESLALQDRRWLQFEKEPF